MWSVEKQTREVKSEERRYTSAKCLESRETQCFFNDLWFLMFEKYRLAKAAGAEVVGQLVSLSVSQSVN